jgi:hypothetical protein
MTRATQWCWSLAGAMALVVVTGCTAQAPSGGTSGQQTSAGTPVSGPARSITDPQHEDAAFGAVVTGTGLDGGTAAFMMLAGSTLKVIDGHTFVAQQAFPNGATAKAAYHLYTGSEMTPGQPPVVTTTRSQNEFRFSLTYAVATADLPAELLPQVLDGLPGGVPSQPERDSALAAIGLAPAWAGAGPAVPMDGDPSNVGVVVDGVISQAVESGIDHAVNTTNIDKTQAGTSWEAFKSGKKVWDALEANGTIADALKRIAAARDCAENPTNPITKQDYADHPGAKEEIIKKLDGMSDEVTGDASVLFVELFTDAGAGLVKVAPWLGFVTGPATNFIKENLGKDIEGNVQAAEQLVPPCRRITYRVTGGGRVTVNGTVASIKAPFTVNGAGDGFRVVFTFTPGDATGKFGSVQYEGWGEGITMSGSGEYTITGKDPGPYNLKKTVHGCVNDGNCATTSDTWKLTPLTQ